MNKNIKFLGMVMLAGAAMTSCSNNDDVLGNADNDLATSNGICFTQASQKSDEGTRSFNATQNTLESFSVDIHANDANNLGSDSPDYMVENQTFTRDANGIYRSDPQYYWPTTGTLNFFAISPVGKTVQADFVAVKDIPTNTFGRSWKDDAGTTDLMAAVSIASEKAGRDQNGAFPLKFKHILSNVTAKFKARDETKDFTYKVKSLILKTYNVGDYTFGSETGSYGSWYIDDSQTADYNFFKTQASPLQFTNKATADVYDDYFILPTTNGTPIFTVEYEVYQSGKKIMDFTGDAAKTVTVAKPSLEMGKRYTYVLALPASEADPITFTVTKVDFEENADKNVSIPAE